jgi:antibiotic biosynthesis monooxygenase (ABM) superfamily enzyme
MAAPLFMRFQTYGLRKVDSLRGSEKGDDMIKHIVMWHVRGKTDADKATAIAQLKSSFESLRGKIPGLLHLELGIDTSRIDYACDVVLYTEFDNQDSLNAYASHPEHLRVKQEVADLRTSRFQVDYTPH